MGAHGAFGPMVVSPLDRWTNWLIFTLLNYHNQNLFKSNNFALLHTLCVIWYVKLKFKKVKLNLQRMFIAINHSVCKVTKAKIIQRINNLYYKEI